MLFFPTVLFFIIFFTYPAWMIYLATENSHLEKKKSEVQQRQEVDQTGKEGVGIWIK